MASAVEISVEAIQESQIQEVTLDGQEIYKPRLSMSENLTKLAHKIDFSKDESEGKGKPTSEAVETEADEEEEEEPVKAAAPPDTGPLQASQWPWDGVRTKLKGALTEMNVLLDVLKIARERRYMVLDHTVGGVPAQDAHEHKHAFNLMAKKRALGAAASLLVSGGDRLRRSQDAMARRTTPEFHYELLKLRNIWRLKKVGRVILGDLTYKSAGSQYWQNGSFEVRKAEADAADPNDTSAQRSNVLQVIVPSELEGGAYIQVAVKRITDSTDLATAELNLSGNVAVSLAADAHWQTKLEAAQNVLYCKEVFAQLAREAVKIKSKIPHMVVGNQIFTHLFPGIQLSIALCLYTEKDKKAPPSPPRPEHNHVLEHSLHQLLREVHYNNTFLPMPHPVTALLGMSKRRRIAGPNGANIEELTNMTLSKTLLEQIVAQGKHIWVWQKSVFVLDEMARTIQDPQMAVHWTNISNATESLIKLSITSAGYENVGFRSPVSLHIDVDSIKAACKDGRIIQLTYEEQELRDFVLCQIALHHISTLQCLSKMMGWQVLSVNTQVGVANMEPVGNALSLVMASPNGQRVLSIRSGPVTGLKVSVQKLAQNTDLPASLDKNWNNLGGEFEPVHLDRLEGKNFVNKIELLMACLSEECC